MTNFVIYENLKNLSEVRAVIVSPSYLWVPGDLTW